MGTLTHFEKLFLWSNKEKSPLKVGLKIVYLRDAAENWIYFSLNNVFEAVYEHVIDTSLQTLTDSTTLNLNNFFDKNICCNFLIAHSNPIFS